MLSSRGRIRLLGNGSGSDDHYWESTRYNGASGNTIRDVAVAGLVVALILLVICFFFRVHPFRSKFV